MYRVWSKVNGNAVIINYSDSNLYVLISFVNISDLENMALVVFISIRFILQNTFYDNKKKTAIAICKAIIIARLIIIVISL